MVTSRRMNMHCKLLRDPLVTSRHIIAMHIKVTSRLDPLRSTMISILPTTLELHRIVARKQRQRQEELADEQRQRQEAMAQQQTKKLNCPLAAASGQAASARWKSKWMPLKMTLLRPK